MNIYEVSIYELKPRSVRLVEHGYFKSDKIISTEPRFIKRDGYTIAKYIDLYEGSNCNESR